MTALPETTRGGAAGDAAFEEVASKHPECGVAGSLSRRRWVARHRAELEAALVRHAERLASTPSLFDRQEAS
jgi:hypothetical protein